jgi:hypothetical protein
MADNFGDQDKGGKRPAPTIEGVATEVAVEPASGPSASAGASALEAEPARRSGEGSAEPQAGPPPASPAELRTFLTHMAAGLLGGLVGVLALAFAWGWLPGAGKKAAAPDLSGLERRLAKLEANPPTTDGETLKALGERLAAVEARAPQTPPDLTDLNARVDSLELSLKTLAASAAKGGSVPDAAALNTAVGEAEQRLQAKLDAALGDVATVDKTAIEDLEQEVAELKKRVGALSENSASGGAVPADSELTALNARIGKLEAALPALTAAIDTGASQTKGAALALAFANLRNAVAAGRPYTTELAALITLAPEDSGLAALASHAQSGIPALPELVRSFTPASETALASTAPTAEASYVDSLLQSVQSLVKIRRIDANATGDAPSAVLARARADLNQGDLGLAVKDVEGLSGAPRETFAGWLDQARSRLAADDTMNRLESTLLASLAASAPAGPAPAPPSP